MQAIADILEDALSRVSGAQDEQSLDAVRVQFLGKKGALTDILKGLGKLTPEERPLVGQSVNEAKAKIQQQIEQKQHQFDASKLAELCQKEAIDVTMPGLGMGGGTLHPITKSLAEITQFFQGLGFDIQEGPQIEDEYHNFEALNIPEHHPARADHDTFYFDADHLLRTHTSNVQIRAMKDAQPPFRLIAPGQVYRCDSDVTHTPMFHQIEGLWVDSNTHFGHLKAVLNTFVKHYFEREVSTRFRPSYFPFTEPSAEMDISCVMCGGEGCRVCSHTGWIEVLGCGMVHPNVLRAVDIDPDRNQGFAFGLGIERFTMLKYGVDDIRLFYENDTRFLKQF